MQFAFYTKQATKEIEMTKDVEDYDYDAGVELDEVSREPQQIEYRKTLLANKQTNKIDT